MELGILGPLAVSEDGRAVEVPGTRPRALLTPLALHPGQVLSAERLAEAGEAQRARDAHAAWFTELARAAGYRHHGAGDLSAGPRSRRGGRRRGGR